ncbi:DUF4129 domain-containing protein [Paenibacillus piri]|uniref:DUF4129 domain-containing protein n=1 Tax=Paenibacillus piri TaxID=2547395 RepID=A0A4R5KUW3_9BACL|nr:DUF4129 domain-containing protein [Paenibacillus piri]TDF99733.1 DUF4129 domain-containing protein [Paenibacillus piri]
MNNPTLRGIGWSLAKGAVELLLAFPLLLAVIVYLLPDEGSLALWLLSLLICYAAGAIGGNVLTLRKRYQLLAFTLAAGALASYPVFGMAAGMLVGLPVGTVFTARGVKSVALPWHVLLPASLYGISLLIYFLASVMMPFFPVYEPYLTLLLWAGLASLAIALLMTNQSNMKQETLSGDKDPVLAGPVVWQNRMLVLGVLAIIVIAVMFRKLQQAVLWLKEQLLAWLRELLSRRTDPPQPDNAAPPPDMSGLGEGGQAAGWLVWLEKAAMLLVEAGFIVLVLVLLYQAGKRLPKLVKKLYAKLMDILARKELRRGSGGYVDDVESLMDWDALRGELAARMKSWLPRKRTRVKWEDLRDNRERVRYLYRSWVQSVASEGYKPKHSLTPKETGQDIQSWDRSRQPAPDSLISVYERVRYGEKTARDAEVAELRQSLEANKRRP